MANSRPIKQQTIDEQAEQVEELKRRVEELEASLEERKAYIRDLESYLARAALKLMDYNDLLTRRDDGS